MFLRWEISYYNKNKHIKHERKRLSGDWEVCTKSRSAQVMHPKVRFVFSPDIPGSLDEPTSQALLVILHLWLLALLWTPKHLSFLSTGVTEKGGVLLAGFCHFLKFNLSFFYCTSSCKKEPCLLSE